MDFTDLAGRYLQTRMDQATQPFTDPNSYMENRLGLNQANVQPKSTTINYNDDGTQTVTQKADIAPPAQPQPEMVPPVPMAPPQMQPPVSMAPPAITPTPAANQILSQPPVAAPVIPQAQPQVAPAGQAMMNPQMPVAPIAPPQPGQAQLIQPPAGNLASPPPAAPAPLIAGTTTTDVGLTPTEQAIKQMPPPNPQEAHVDNIITNQNNPSKLMEIAGNNTPPEAGGPHPAVKQLASEHVLQDLQGTKKKMAEEKKASDMIENNDQKGIARVLASKESEGSYLKAYLFNRLGLTQLAQQEEIKLGAGSRLQRVALPDGTTALVRLRGDNVATHGVDVNTGQELTPDQLGQASISYMKGAETGAAMYKTRDGHVITMTRVPGQVQPIYYDNTENKQLTAAPLGLTPLGQKDTMIEEGMKKKSQIESRMRIDNNKAGGRLYTEADIQAAGNDAFRSLVGYNYNAREHGVVSPVEEARQGEPGPVSQTQINQGIPTKQVSGQGEFTDPSIQIISGHRPTQQQQDMWDESVRAGRTGFTAQGNPIARPGTSLHETDNARDIDSAKLTKAGRQELYQKGWYQPIPQQDPNHWERIGTPTVSAPGAPAPATAKPGGVNANIESQAQAIANYQSKPTTSGGAQGPYNQAVMARVRELNPDYDESKWDTAKKTRQAFTTGKQGDTVRSMNVAVDHLDTLDKAAQALNNGDIPLFNNIANQYSKNTGSPVVTNFDGIKSIVGSEVAKAVSGAGGSALGDREEIRKEINAANSPQQLAGIIKKYQELMAGQLKGLKLQYEESGLKDFDNKIAPGTKNVLGRIEKEGKNTRSNW